MSDLLEIGYFGCLEELNSQVAAGMSPDEYLKEVQVLQQELITAVQTASYLDRRSILLLFAIGIIKLEAIYNTYEGLGIGNAKKLMQIYTRAEDKFVKTKLKGKW